MTRVRRTLAGLSALFASVLALTFSTASPASAFGGETFGCRIAPGSVFTWDQFCTNSAPANEYNVGFAVFGTDSSYSFQWSISGRYRSVITGCTATSYDCALAVGRGAQDITVTVTYAQNGVSGTQTAYADIEPYCGSQLC